MKSNRSVKISLLIGSAIALALPVMATQNVLPLRGAWNASHYAVPSAPAIPTREQYLRQAQANQAQANQAYGYGYAPAPQHRGVQLRGHSAAYYAAPVQTVAAHQYARAQYSPQQAGPLQYNPQQYGQSYATPSRSFSAGDITVRTSVAHSDRMLDWQENTTGKALTILQHRKNGILAPNSIYIGAGVKGGLMWQKTDIPGQFPILARFPDFSNRTDDQTGTFVINNAALAITSTFGDWTSIYLQPEYTETNFSSQGEFSLRKAFVTFGNLDKSPFYASFGRKTIDFGNFDGYNPFTQTESQHYFWALADQPVLELGYYNNGLKVTASAFSAGRQLRTAFAGEENNLGNYAASIEKEFLLDNNSAFTVGTSYLHDTIYRNNFTAHTFADVKSGTPPANFIEYRNSAVSAFAEYNSDVFDAMIEYTTTLEPWAAAIPQNTAGVIEPGYENFDENLTVTVAQVRYRPRMFNGDTAFSVVGSWGNISDDNYVGTGLGFPGAPAVTFGSNEQHVIGVEHRLNPYMDFGAEYVYNKGFIPFVAPQLVSNQDTVAHAVNVGFKARF